MREKKLHFVVTFYTTAEAVATERLCKTLGISGKLFSAPRSVSADCGIAWKSEIENKERLIDELSKSGIEVQGFHELEL
ncbi:MAG: DUF3343 domain-containing protein [Saccharofermentans sp.]|nr:DUF3343 domain-containing protein [Saccharofermentans sp.]